MPPRYRREAWLREQYHERGRTQQEMADACDVSPRTIREWMNRHGIETRDLEGEDHPLYGKERAEDVKERISETLAGREFDEETRAKMSDAHSGKDLSEEQKRRISAALRNHEKSETTRQRMSESRLGEDNPRWKGGHSRNYGPGWTAAREAVRNRDEVCRNCGADRSSSILEVHHIIPVREFQQSDEIPTEEAHDERNLVLLCRNCHVEAHHGTLSFTTEISHPADR
ncbi:HNH endonuclease [Natronomonas halophila]|uniref:NUMOD3 domain-containing DNA-binding protein n=1 Tax=Natronomonas halophila TaxID=2747817 RepID=UPI0015B46B9C|nr:NUMOD3 domain-containing DNA-binding protein [Natronomonas halophila]QLD87157.1 HNH endonuclease [Natronomonas halophila]